jgi:hypothetical protein
MPAYNQNKTEVCSECYEVKERRFDECMAYYIRYNSRSEQTFNGQICGTIWILGYIKKHPYYVRDEQTRNWIKERGYYGT